MSRCRLRVTMWRAPGAVFLLAIAAGSTAIVTGSSQARAAEPSGVVVARYAAKDMGWSLRLPKDDNVVYQGVASYDRAGGGAAPILYPAPNVAGFLVGLFTHGVLLESVRAVEKNRIQQVADEVLAPYQKVLSSYKHRDLMQQALDKTDTGGSKRLLEPSEKPSAGLLIDSTPVFSMTQDQTAIVLDNVVSIYAPGAAPAAAYRNIIRVVSKPETRTDLVSFWTANDGDVLKAQSVSLLAESLDLALIELATVQEHDRPQRTIRYLEGTAERMERGQIVHERCDKVVLKNLRGWLMSVPVKSGASAAAAPCGEIALREELQRRE
jgi:hypothetical protein